MDELRELLQNSALSLGRVGVGVVIATFVGIALGLWRSALPAPVKRNPLVRFLFEAPKFPPPIAWIPFVILLFGIGERAAYVIVFIGAFSPIFIGAYQGAESLPRIWHETAASLEIPRGRFLREVVFPGALPQILVGLRAGVSMGWMSVIAAEMISGQSGLGYDIQLNRLNLQHERMVADIVMIGLIGFLLFEGIAWLERRLVPWAGK